MCLSKKTFSIYSQYQLDHLKSLCEHWLCSHLTVESVASTLLLADMHNAAELKTRCIDFAVANSSVVFCTQDYRDLITTRVELSMELLTRYLSAQNQF